ncbi:MAG TPA: hypothetical protein VMS17_14415 [Gemmataceae bacterium]|nr:hypothetical protein [Gemmataceae bacterium]
MADKSTTLILGALGRAAASADGAPLFAARGDAGLFPATAVGRQAAQRCKDEGWIRVLSPECEASPASNGAGDTAVLVRKKRKTASEIGILTEKGLAWLLDQSSPRQVLEDFVRALEARQCQGAEMLTALKRMQAGFDALKAGVEKALGRLPGRGAAPSESLTDRFQHFHQQPVCDAPSVLLVRLTEWQTSGASEDCPLPELFRRSQAAAPLTVGAFHDGLRRLHESGRIYLHPWTGPLHALPEPPFALLVGHEIAYYASLRQG